MSDTIYNCIVAVEAEDTVSEDARVGENMCLSDNGHNMPVLACVKLISLTVSWSLHVSDRDRFISSLKMTF